MRPSTVCPRHRRGACLLRGAGVNSVNNERPQLGLLPGIFSTNH
ncbi:hypothetical protein BJ970_006633 [Saccharopolyspora phatthalungensis]|uniref:Uncharacterized protein n=1 Tax=Saccharopolyspora phatthalungensis TaxID=664693 RepID=A0A840QE13_9PSEU|nr:hypothetical protein [Saccharopolyspora phatthalungensis]